MTKKIVDFVIATLTLVALYTLPTHEVGTVTVASVASLVTYFGLGWFWGLTGANLVVAILIRRWEQVRD